MIQSMIPRALSTFLKHRVNALLIGGQACILYGAAEFSRDIDISVMISSENLEKLRLSLAELGAERIFVPDLSVDVLMRGHACHFRCQKEDLKGMRIDIIGVMRGVDAFPELWRRRQEIDLPGIGKIAVIGLSDLVKTKKTQRDKDWPMIRRLIEADIYNAPANPSQHKVYFWLTECRTPELLVSLAAQYTDIASQLAVNRPLLNAAIEDDQACIQKLLRDEEDKERELDRQYWTPLKVELETWRHNIVKKE
ncbi:MAG: hypothetical protein HY738_13160 [Bacteroidia bacterium]|nr:hypothetical protein [Bacteroidia bacterium]